MNNLADVNLLGVRVIGDQLEKMCEAGRIESTTNISSVACEHGALAAASYAISNPPNFVAQSKIRKQQCALQPGKQATTIKVGDKVVNVSNYSCATAADKRIFNNKLYLMTEESSSDDEPVRLVKLVKKTTINHMTI